MSLFVFGFVAFCRVKRSLLPRGISGNSFRDAICGRIATESLWGRFPQNGFCALGSLSAEHRTIRRAMTAPLGRWRLPKPTRYSDMQPLGLARPVEVVCRRDQVVHADARRQSARQRSLQNRWRQARQEQHPIHSTLRQAYPHRELADGAAAALQFIAVRERSPDRGSDVLGRAGLAGRDQPVPVRTEQHPLSVQPLDLELKRQRHAALRGFDLRRERARLAWWCFAGVGLSRGSGGQRIAAREFAANSLETR